MSLQRLFIGEKKTHLEYHSQTTVNNPLNKVWHIKTIVNESYGLKFVNYISCLITLSTVKQYLFHCVIWLAIKRVQEVLDFFIFAVEL